MTLSQGSKICLVLNDTYEALSFVNERQALKLFFKDKVEVISYWGDLITTINSSFRLPAILRLKYHISRSYYNSDFNRRAIFKRDKFRCQYCNLHLMLEQVTIDHILPRSLGGDNSFENCVVSCFPCNACKGNRMPEQAGMKLLRKPFVPPFAPFLNYSNKDQWHPDWEQFLGNELIK